MRHRFLEWLLGTAVYTVAGLAAGAGLVESMGFGGAPGFAIGLFWREVGGFLLPWPS